MTTPVKSILYWFQVHRQNKYLREQLQEAISEMFELDRQYDAAVERMTNDVHGKPFEVGGLKLRWK